MVPWWHRRHEVPLCWRADKSGGAGWSNRVSAWGGVTEPGAQRTCAPRLTVRPRHVSRGVKTCTDISQIRFCSAPLKSFTRAARTTPCFLSCGDALLGRALQARFCQTRLRTLIRKTSGENSPRSDQRPREKSPAVLACSMFVLDRSGLVLSLVHADLCG